jgi:hypothetical protein
MRIIDRKIWISLVVTALIALISSTTILGGIEWTFGSMGALVLIGITGIGVHTAYKVLQQSKLSNKTRRSGCDGSGSRDADVGPVNKKDKRMIMKHIDELFDMGLSQNTEKPAKAVPISLKDKRIILQHIDELFTGDLERKKAISTEIRPINKDDKRIIMRYIDELFKIDQKHSGDRAF